MEEAPEFDSNASSVALRFEARERLSNASLRGGPHASERLRDRINGSFEHYTGPNRVDSARVFDRDSNVVAQTRGDASEVSDRILAADARLANTSLQDAERALAALEARNVSFDERRAGRTLDRARTRFGNGERRWERGQYAAAVAGYRGAWRQSQRLIDDIGRDVDPGITLRDRADPIRNASGNYTIEGSVFAVRPERLANLTVRVGGESMEVPLQGRPAAGTPVPFSTTVSIENRTAEVVVEARVTVEDGQRVEGSDRVTLRLDGDGISDRVEANTTGTDPLDPDSDSTVTDADEAGDGTIDGREDFDGDRMVAENELDRDLDPVDPDTDDDGLLDGDEVAITSTDPLSNDTDGDGVADGQEDPDGDGLAHVDEIEAGGHPNATDGDADGLADPREIENGTSLLDADTDDDGLTDGEELDLGTDPLVNDTDGDGVLDGNETFTTTATNESLGVTISLTGAGNAARETTVSTPREAHFTGGRAPRRVATSEFVDVDVDGSIDNATVTMEYDESAVQTQESSIAVYRINDSTSAYHRLSSSVDTENDTVTATTSHFSTIVALDPGAALDLVQERASRDVSSSTDFRTVGEFSFETDDPVSIPSGSSATVNGHTWRCWNVPRSDGYMDTPISGSCVFEDGRAIVREETNRFRYLEHEVRLPDVDRSDALFVDATLTAEIQNAWSNAGLRMVVGTDGGETVQVFRLEHDEGYSDEYVEASPRMNVTQFAGREVTISLLANGRHVYETQDTLSTIEVEHLTIERRSGSGVDTDGDGISDAWEEGGVPLEGTTRTVQLDPDNPDTDGDGLRDGQEVDTNEFHAADNFSDADSIHFPGFEWSSDPADSDTDDDGLDDATEVEGWEVDVITRDGELYRYDDGEPTEQDGRHDEVTFTSDPTDYNSDDDALSDSEERHDTHTDPEEPTTYAITEEHEREILDVLGSIDSQERYADRAAWVQFLENSGFVARSPATVPTSADRLRGFELDDFRDDFDFVTPDEYESHRENVQRFTFTGIDRNQITDTWMPNWQEIRGADMDPWDPDTDDDGLTDSQEEIGVSYVHAASFAPIIFSDQEYLSTNPTDPDTDGDGWWDGSIGVYGVGSSDDVVLYMEHLRDDDDGDGDTTDDGVQGEEIVQEQVGYHESSDAPLNGGTDIDDDGHTEHSNLHLGERFWQTDPATNSDRPTPGLTVEVDYHERANLALDDPAWRTSIEDNYRLYGINVRVERGGDVLDNDDLQDGRFDLTPGVAFDSRPPFSSEDLFDVHWNFASGFAEHYLFVASVAADSVSGGSEQTGVTRRNYLTNPVTGTQYVEWQEVMAVFTDAHSDEVEAVPAARLGLTADEAMRAATAKTAVHEIGHILDLGEADDRGGEIYSGDDGQQEADYTPEVVEDRSLNSEVDDWSVMSSGIQRENFLPQTGTTYTAFSIEELQSMESEHLDP